MHMNLYFITTFPFVKNSISMSWGGWSDDLSGIWKFEYEMYEIRGTPLVEGKIIATGTIYLNTSHVSYRT